MSRVDNWAEIIYNFLRNNEDQHYRIASLADGTKLRVNADFRKAIARARILAEVDGYKIPCATPNTDHTYVCTKDPRNVFRPAMHLHVQAAGTKQTARAHDDFMAGNTRGLSRSQRRVLEVKMRFDKSIREIEDDVKNLVVAFIEQDREHRKEKSLDDQ